MVSEQRMNAPWMPERPYLLQFILGSTDMSSLDHARII